MRAVWYLLIPATLGVIATLTDYLPAKMGVPLAYALILFLALRPQRSRSGADVYFVIAAFLFSAAGDYFLSNKSGQELYFVIGIGLYLLAHLGYLGFAWRNGRLHWLVLGALLLIFLPYYFLLLNPAIPDPLLSVSVLAYLLISCLALAVAAGLRLAQPVKGSYVLGVALIVLSDTVISFNEFLRYRELNWLILPTYYLAHLSISYALLRRGERIAERPLTATP
jgi:uncharacterized membrane protein YhhN